MSNVTLHMSNLRLPDFHHRHQPLTSGRRRRVQQDEGHKYSRTTNTKINQYRSRTDAGMLQYGGGGRLTGLSFTTGLVIRISHDGLKRLHQPEAARLPCISLHSAGKRRCQAAAAFPLGIIPTKEHFQTRHVTTKQVKTNNEVTWRT